MSAVVQSELNILAGDLRNYQELSGKTPEQTMLKQGGKLAAHLSSRLVKFMPGKGVVTTERLEALKQGEGVYVRPTVRQSVYAKYSARTDISSRQQVFGKKGKATDSKGRNLQALAVKRELAVRESGGGFMSYSARGGATKFGGLPGLKPGARKVHVDRYKRYLASVGINVSSITHSATLTFSWGAENTRSERVAKLLQTPRFQAEVVGAIKDTSADIRKYVPGHMAAIRKRTLR